jgi:hypothetical protein
MATVDADRNREWLRALRRFKYGIKVRAKFGVIDAYCEQVALERKGVWKWDAPLWRHDDWVTLLYTCIKNNEYPPKLLLGFVKTAEVTFYTPRKQPTPLKVLVAIDEVCRDNSKELRRKFGVFL